MTKCYVLIDYENVQPADLKALRNGPTQVKLFVGPSQPKIPVELAASLHGLGANAEYVLLESAGLNALDFHIAYYIGVLTVQDPGARFHVISKDKGFDPLIKHLKLKGIDVQRFPAITAIDSGRPVPASSIGDHFQSAVAHLKKLKAAKPRTERTLRSTLNAFFKKQLSDAQVSAVLAKLCDKGVVKIEGTKVTYAMET